MMRKQQFFTHFKCTLALLALSAYSSVQADINFPIPDAPQLQNVGAYILIDAKSGEILTQHNADQRRDPASLTKMMTSYVIGEAIKSGRISNSDMVLISKDAWATGNPVLKGSSLMFLEVGKQVSVEDLNKGIIIQSGNDACIAMAEHVAGSQDSFVGLMNNYVKQLGLENTHFQTVHGLDAPDQYTTAHDMAFLGQALINNLPNEYAIYKQKEFKYNLNKPQLNRNGLLWDTTLNVDGIKTGHTNNAGFNLVASAVDGNTRLISVVMGAKSDKERESKSKQLLIWGFRSFETTTPVKANESKVTKTIWYGKEDKVELGSMDDIYVTVPKGQAVNLQIKYKMDSDYISAPIEQGVKVGTMQFLLNDQVVAEKPLVTLEKVEETGLFGMAVDYVALKFRQWFSYFFD